MMTVKTMSRKMNFRKRGFENRALMKHLAMGGLQTVHTPFPLCHKIVGQLSDSVDLTTANILVMFNPEFLPILITDYGVSPSNITFASDASMKSLISKDMYNVDNTIDISFFRGRRDVGKLKGMFKKQFDIVLMNPPYNKPPQNQKIGSGNFLWPEFVHLAMDLLKSGGWLGAVHPPKWRKPKDELLSVMQGYNLIYLSMHSISEKVFGPDVSTAVDWYVMCKEPYQGRTHVKCKTGELDLNISEWPFVPNGHFEILRGILAKGDEERCSILYGQMQEHIPVEKYDTRYSTVNKHKNKTFRYPLVNGVGKKGINYYYCSETVPEEWQVPKVICQVSIDTRLNILERNAAVMRYRQMARKIITNLLRTIPIGQRHRVNNIAQRFGHF